MLATVATFSLFLTICDPKSHGNPSATCHAMEVRKGLPSMDSCMQAGMAAEKRVPGEVEFICFVDRHGP